MIAPADPYLAAFAKAGADIITVHAEAGPHLHRSLQAIRALGKKAGVALNPGDAGRAHRARDRPGRSDPGDDRQSRLRRPGFIPAALDKIAQVRALIGGRPIDIEVDGGITPETAAAGRARRRQRAGRRLGGVQGRQPGPTRANIAAIRNAAALARVDEARMIPRYSRPEMAAIWSPETRFRIWFEIEAHAADAMAELGRHPEGSRARPSGTRASDAKFDVARIDAIERETKHDVIAFLTHLAEIVGPEARFVHQGMTSSDVLDTCFAVQLTRAADLLLADLDALLAALKRRAFEHKMTPTIGRSHGIHAEPTTFGLKLAQAYAEFARARDAARSRRARRSRPARSPARSAPSPTSIRASKRMSPKAWGSRPSRSRRRSSRATATRCSSRRSASIASSIERLATEIRHLQRTEVLEAEEFFSPGQKGSSAMPHKRNPVLSENLTGLARMVRAYVTPALENVALWHERDISHSSVERMIGPDATVTLDFALARLAGLIDKLLVYPENMQKNLDRLGGLIHSQRVLLALTQKGVAREDAYALVQRNAMQVWRGEGDFLAFLKADPDVTRVPERGRDRGELRPRLSPQARRHDLRARVRRIEALGSNVLSDPSRARPPHRRRRGTRLRRHHRPVRRGPLGLAPAVPAPVGIRRPRHRWAFRPGR